MGEQAVARPPPGPPCIEHLACARRDPSPARSASRPHARSSATTSSPTATSRAAVLELRRRSSPRGRRSGHRVAVVDVGGLASTVVILGAARIGAAAALMNVQLKPTGDPASSCARPGCSPVGVAGSRTAPRSPSRPSTVWCSVPPDLVAGRRRAHGDTAEDDDARRARALHQRNDRASQAIPISQGTLSQRLASMMTGAVRSRRTADRRHDVRPDLPRRAGARVCSARCSPAHDRDPAPLRCRRVAPPGGAAPDLVGVPRADDARSASSTIPTSPTTDLSDLQGASTTAPPPRLSSSSSAAMAALPHVAFANIFGQTETLGAYTTLTPADHFVAANGSGPSGVRFPASTSASSTRSPSEDVATGEVGELWVLSDQNVRPRMAAHRRSRPPRRRRLHLPERSTVGHDQPRG